MIWRLWRWQHLLQSLLQIGDDNYDRTFRTAVLISITVFSRFADREKFSDTWRVLMCFFVAVTSTIHQMSTRIVATCIECRVIIIIRRRRRRRKKKRKGAKKSEPQASTVRLSLIFCWWQTSSVPIMTRQRKLMDSVLYDIRTDLVTKTRKVERTWNVSSRKGEIANTMATAARLQEKCKSLICLASQNEGKHDDKIDDFRRIITRNFKCSGRNLKNTYWKSFCYQKCNKLHSTMLSVNNEMCKVLKKVNIIIIIIIIIICLIKMCDKSRKVIFRQTLKIKVH